MIGSVHIGITAAAECFKRGDRDGARSLCDDVLAGDPDCADALNLLAGIAACEGEFESALSLARRASALRPDDVVLMHNRGVICSAIRRWEEAAGCFSRVLESQPDNAAALLNYADAAYELNRFADAAAACERALSAGADPDDTRIRLAKSLFALRRFDEAAALCARAISSKPDDPRAYLLLGDIHARHKRLEEQLACATVAAHLRPNSPEALSHLGLAYADIGETAYSIALLRRSLELGPDTAQVGSLLLWMLLHDSAQTAQTLAEEHKAWSRAHRPDEPAWTAWENSPDPERRLRVGYVSGEFTAGPFAFFLRPILVNHDRGRFEIHCYNVKPSEDRLTPEFRRLADVWRDAGALSDDELAESIRQDGIDILVDLSGHYPANRLRMFARHPAPVQAAFPNYPCTTGVAEIDYIITDRWTAPEGSEGQYAERPWRLDSGYLTYLPPEDLPEAGPLPALKNGFVTFGLFQRGAKLNNGVWDAIAAVLGRVPGSRLLVHNGSRDLDNPASRTCRTIADALATRGVASERIAFRGSRRLHAHLALIAECDINLDTFPYNGQTTSCDSLWMGVPVVTLSGDAHVARVGREILARVGLEDWIAGSVEEYVSIAARAAVDLDSLAALRSSLRTRAAESPLGDHARVTRDLEHAYRGMWRAWCAKQRRAL